MRQCFVKKEGRLRDEFATAALEISKRNEERKRREDAANAVRAARTKEVTGTRVLIRLLDGLDQRTCPALKFYGHHTSHTTLCTPSYPIPISTHALCGPTGEAAC